MTGQLSIEEFTLLITSNAEVNLAFWKRILRLKVITPLPNFEMTGHCTVTQVIKESLGVPCKPCDNQYARIYYWGKFTSPYSDKPPIL